MSTLITTNPTANASPDPGQGGIAVSSPTNLGHSSTIATGNNSTVFKTCKWSGFGAVNGDVVSKTLKMSWSENGRIDNPINDANEFIIQYSLNGGGSWITIFDHVDITTNQSSSSSVTLPPSQDLTQVQVRDLLLGSSDTLGLIGQMTASVSNIRIETVLQDISVVSSMM